ncbi:MAG: cell division protein ZapA [Betaproteobacteria bacterium]|nr:cell division protein ZapA [Betaproteobacteria bacterium]MDE2002682.1 cell division protein ZapA [Betaproteobacteria bacterium]MDE2210888.1 cell division protein ZapA [Betaproteobacteria bacterium]
MSAGSGNPSHTVTLSVTILGRDLKIACKEDEREELGEAVTFLDRRMREIRDAGKVSGSERIAVMAALNIAHELLRARRSASSGSPRAAAAAGVAAAGVAVDDDAARRRIRAMQAAIDEALAGQEKLF